MLKRIAGIQPSALYFSYALFFGVIYLFFTPPFQSPDEPNHLFRAFQVSEGVFLTTEAGSPVASIPESLLINVNKTLDGIPFSGRKVDWKAISQEMSRPLEASVRRTVGIPNTGLYAPLAYFPQAVGIMVGRMFNLSSLSLLYMARVFNFAFAMTVLCLAFRWLEHMRWTLLFLALLPMTFSLTASASADASNISVCFLLFSLIVREFSRINKKLAQDWGYWTMLLVFFLVMFCKQTYAVYAGPVTLLFFYRFIKLDRNPKFFATSALAILFAIGVGLFWSKLASQIYIEIRGDVDSKMQLSLIKAAPLKYFGIMGRNLFHGFFGHDIFPMLLGRLGWLDAPVREGILWMLGASLFVVTLTDRPLQGPFGKTFSCLCFLCGLIGFHLLAMAMFLTYTPTNAPWIDGIQGRYFLPLWPLFSMPFAYLSFQKIPENFSRILSLTVLPLGLIGGLYAIFERWY